MLGSLDRHLTRSPHCDRLERVLKAAVPDPAVTIHVEPEDKREHQGIVVL